MVTYEMVAYGRWSLTRGSRYERVDCSISYKLIAESLKQNEKHFL